LAPQCTIKRDFEKKTSDVDFLLPLGHDASFDKVVEVVGMFPLIAVTQAENLRLLHKVSTTPRQRYATARIEVGRVEKIVWEQACVRRSGAVDAHSVA
jgi:hypothetical protein